MLLHHLLPDLILEQQVRRRGPLWCIGVLDASFSSRFLVTFHCRTAFTFSRRGFVLLCNLLALEVSTCSFVLLCKLLKQLLRELRSGCGVALLLQLLLKLWWKTRVREVWEKVQVRKTTRRRRQGSGVQNICKAFRHCCCIAQRFCSLIQAVHELHNQCLSCCSEETFEPEPTCNFCISTCCIFSTICNCFDTRRDAFRSYKGIGVDGSCAWKRGVE